MILVLTIAGCVAALVAVYVVATQTKVEEALAGETTVAAAADPSAETLSTGRFTAAPRPSEVRSEWQLATVNNLSDAEELLDVLENSGVAERELVVLGNTCFAVRWR